MEIREQLKQFQAKFSITYLAPNCTIDTFSSAFQLQLLTCRALDEEDFIVDLVPWCPEYESCDLPWIITQGAEGKIEDSVLGYICIQEIGCSFTS